MQARSDAELRALTAAFRERAAGGEDLKSLLPEAFAAVREASVRTLGLRHFDVQLIGGIGSERRPDRRDEDRRGQDARVHACRLPERAARQQRAHRHRQRLPGRAATASGWAQVYRFLGHGRGPHLRTACAPTRRSPRYKADVTYGTNNEFGFDYLRDNMVTRPGGPRAARPSLRHRRRGGLHPHRRGPHPAHHLGRGHAGGRDVQQVRARHAGPRARGRLRHGRGEEDHQRHRERPGEDRGHARHRRHLRRPVRPARRTTCSRRSRRSSCSIATWTTSWWTAR